MEVVFSTALSCCLQTLRKSFASYIQVQMKSVESHVDVFPLEPGSQHDGILKFSDRLCDCLISCSLIDEVVKNRIVLKNEF